MVVQSHWVWLLTLRGEKPGSPRLSVDGNGTVNRLRAGRSEVRTLEPNNSTETKQRLLIST